MSKIARKPIIIPEKVEVKLDQDVLNISGVKGKLCYVLHTGISLKIEGRNIFVVYDKNKGDNVAILGTASVLIRNMLTGVSVGFEKVLRLVGVGYKAKVQGSSLDLSLGFSHPVVYKIPQGISIDTPTNTDIIIRGINKELLGQVAADIRAFKPPEVYKGKGIRYDNEQIITKEVKKK